MAGEDKTVKTELWIEVINVRLDRKTGQTKTVAVLVKSDKYRDEQWIDLDPTWVKPETDFADTLYRDVAAALDKHQPVLCKIEAPRDHVLTVTALRTLHSESTPR